MPCVNPRRQWLVEGKWTLNEPRSPALYRVQEFGCGECSPCRLSEAGLWTTRLVHEGLMHEDSICATLTYEPKKRPPLGSVSRPDVSSFVRALRQVVRRRGGSPFSFDATGEYSPTMVPHVHIALFGYLPPDLKKWGKSQAGNQEYISEELSNAWGKGRVTFQLWTTGSAQYCASHQAHKLVGDKGRAQRMVYAPNGEAIGERAPEFHACSTRPGIGRRFFERYGEDALRRGYSVIDGRKVPVPSYYLRRGDVDCPELAEAAREARRALAQERAAALEGDYRLDAIETCAEARIQRGAQKDVFK